jgi:hypothetical protein
LNKPLAEVRTASTACNEPAKQAASIKPSVEPQAERWVSVQNNMQARVSGRQRYEYMISTEQRAAAHFMGLGGCAGAGPSVPLRCTLGFMLAARSRGLVE